MENNYKTYILVPIDREDTLPIDRVTSAGARLSDAFLYRGSLTYMPIPNGGVAIYAMHGRSKPETTEWLIRTLAGELSALILDESREPMFLDSDDNDISFLDSLPAPEEEAGPIRLQFSISSDSPIRMHKVMDIVEEFSYEFSAESDGLAIALSASIYLDLFFSDGDREISGDVDLTFGGARLYLDALHFACKLAKELGAEISAVPDARITYPLDRDFEKLRRVFYIPIKQQLSYAVMDDREGMQAFFGWGTDNVEPFDIAGTIVSAFGRFNIDQLKEEIRTFGFSFVADHYLLACNTPSRSADFLIRDGLIHAWNQWLGRRIGDVAGVEQYESELFITSFDEALTQYPNAPFPTEFYKKLCESAGKKPLDTSKCLPYRMHYEPSYRLKELYYGFGHYLRRVKLPGDYPHLELSHGYDGVIIDDFFEKNRFTLQFAIKYYDGEAQPTENFGENFAIGEIELFDIGGSSYGRFCRGDMVDGRYRAEAEIVIRGERYHFALSTSDRESVDLFRESIMASRSIEEWYDDYGGDEFDPHAPGGTFCTNGEPFDEFLMNPFPDPRYEHLMQPYDEEELPDPTELVGKLFGEITTTFQPLIIRPIADLANASKLGGQPYLPSDVEIPRDYDGNPLRFLAQLNCTDVDLDTFPDHGILSIWCGDDLPPSDSVSTNEQNHFRVLYFPDAPSSEVPTVLDLLNVPEDSRAFSMLPQYPIVGSRSESANDGFTFVPSPESGCRIGGHPHYLSPEERAHYDTLLLRLDTLSRFNKPPIAVDRDFALELAIHKESLLRGDFSDIMLVFRILS